MQRTPFPVRLSPAQHPVEIVALLPDHLLHPFRAVSTRTHAIRRVRTLAELDATLRVHVTDLLIVDPQIGGPSNFPALATLLDRFKSTVHVVVYTTVSADALRACHALGGGGYRHVVLFGVDDQPKEFRALLESVPADALSDALVERLSDRLSRLPVRLGEVLRALYRVPRAIDTVPQLAARAGMARRTLYDVLERVGLATPAHHLEAARVLRAYHYLRAPGARVRDVAAKLQYPTPDALASAVRAVTGFLPSSLARKIDPDDMVSRTAQFLRYPGAGRGEPEPATVPPGAAGGTR